MHKMSKNTISVCVVNEQPIECRKQFNKIELCNKRADFVRCILHYTKSALFCLFQIGEKWGNTGESAI